MSTNILHISDLHFRSPSEQDKNIYYSNSNFCDEFASFVNEHGKPDYLIFTGDAINQGYVKAFDDAKIFFEKIIEKLDIDKNHVLLCMGNHDFDRHELEMEFKNIPSNDPNRQQRIKAIHTSDTKYEYFKSFVKDVVGRNLNVKDAIYDCIIDEDNKFMLLGVNTCYLESYDNSSHKGMIDKDQFVYKLLGYLKDYPNYKVFFAMHHNPAIRALGNEIATWKDILFDLQQKSVMNRIVVFSGHVHYIETSVCEQDENEGESAADVLETGIYYFSAGSLLNTEYKSRSFNLYKVEGDEINYHFYTHIDSEGNPFWRETNSDAVTLKERIISPNSKCQEDERKDPLALSPIMVSDAPSILEYIGKHGLLYSGHFHWNSNEKTGNCDFKSHGYIDINYLVSHVESLEIITQLFKKKIEEIQKKTTLTNVLIVAIGLECSVIGARLSVMFPEFHFSYLPRKHKADDHNDIENNIGLNINNYGTIILIKDIIIKTSKSETEEIIRDLFYGKDIHLISLFYCGKKDKKNKIFQGMENVHFYSLIDDIEIPRCDLDESKCPVIKNNLQTIFIC